LYLNNKSEEVAKELISLFSKATPQDHSALEEILETIISESVSKEITIIKPQSFAHMWNYFIRYEREQVNQP
jgi:transcriptional regulatory protein LevR